MGRAPMPPMRLPVGTHALRVTHERYRDWVRFVDVPFDQAVALSVDLREFPMIANEMRERATRSPVPRGPAGPVPWYRRGWAVAGMGAALAVITTIAVATTVDRLHVDGDIVLGAEGRLPHERVDAVELAVRAREPAVAVVGRRVAKQAVDLLPLGVGEAGALDRHVQAADLGSDERLVDPDGLDRDDELLRANLALP